MRPRSRYWNMLDYIIRRQRDSADVLSTRAMAGLQFTALTDTKLIPVQLAIRTAPKHRKEQTFIRRVNHALFLKTKFNQFKGRLGRWWKNDPILYQNIRSPQVTKHSAIAIYNAREGHQPCWNPSMVSQWWDMLIAMCREVYAETRAIYGPTRRHTAPLRSTTPQIKWWCAPHKGYERHSMSMADVFRWFAGPRLPCGSISLKNRPVVPVREVVGYVIIIHRGGLQAVR